MLDGPRQAPRLTGGAPGSHETGSRAAITTAASCARAGEATADADVAGSGPETTPSCARPRSMAHLRDRRRGGARGEPAEAGPTSTPSAGLASRARAARKASLSSAPHTRSTATGAPAERRRLRRTSPAYASAGARERRHHEDAGSTDARLDERAGLRRSQPEVQ